MRNFTADQIRSMFLEFFRGKDHRILPSASLIPHGDPTLLLTVAGMVPFKHQFLGLEKPVYPRLATSQKCIRTADIENVGLTTRHGTFFEMLGNFSFGDYFKAEIIPWAWEFVVDHLKLPPARLWVTVYLDDDEAHQIWREKVGVPEERIVRLGKEDNFWETGHGPCGPCSEIYIDRGAEFGCGKPDCKPGCDCERYFEFWNLVFIQFHQEGDTYTPLAEKSIDTGLGLERVAALLQNKSSIFEVDNIYPILEAVCAIAQVTYGAAQHTDTSLRVITDHARAVTFLVSDGVLPSNEGRGYVLRRLIRRAVRHARLLGITRPFLKEVTGLVIDKMQGAYPELAERQKHIFRIVDLEEERFNETLEQGMRLLEQLVHKAKQTGSTEIAGQDAFQLYDTFGFPLDLTREILAEEGFEVDEQGFRQAMEAQRQRARQSRTAHGYLDSSLEVYGDLAGAVVTEFVGYREYQTSAEIQGLIVDGRSVDQARQGERVAVVLNRTPFYAEGGGQVADQGVLESGLGLVRINDVRRPVEGLIIHAGLVEQGFVTVGSTVCASIAQERRQETARHHTATHLLHSALRGVLGDHVNQAGSYVGPERLRFDFTHYQALGSEEIREIEDQVNAEIWSDHAVIPSTTDLEDAKRQGAMALFGEKYGSKVRMVQIGDKSLELCGGAHVKSTGQIGLFKIISEGSVAAGVRRIEAVAGGAALAYLRMQDEVLKKLQGRLQCQMDELPGQLERLQDENKELTKEIADLKQQDILSALDQLLEGAERVGPVALVVAEVTAEHPEDLRALGDRLRDHLDPAAILLAAENQGKVLFLSMVSKSLVSSGLHAGQVVKAAAQVCGGGGGGRADMAQAGGRFPDQLTLALQEGRNIFLKQMEGIRR